MLTVPVSVRGVLPHLVAATEACGYAGMLVVLARTADARAWHNELTTDWTSIHDVTGPFVAVICPDPSGLTNRATGLFAHHAEANGLSVVCPPGLASIRPGNNDSFESRYDDSYVRVPIGDRVREVPYRASAIRPEEAELLHAAWSEATSRCAAYFGIPEDMIPSVLVLSLPEKVAVLARLPEDASLYSFCKGLTTGLGDLPQRTDLLRAERAELTESLYLLRSSQEWDKRHPEFHEPKPPPPPPDPVPPQLIGLDQHLELVADVDPELVGNWRARLSTVVVEPPYAEVLELALDIAEEVNESPEKARWRHLNRKARKVVNAVDEIRRRPVPPDLVESRIAREGARLKGVESELAELAADLPLADSVQAAALQLLGNPDITLERGRDGLAGWQVRMLQAGGRTPLRWATQRA
jgi:hypothetical protein